MSFIDFLVLLGLAALSIGIVMNFLGVYLAIKGDPLTQMQMELALRQWAARHKNILKLDLLFVALTFFVVLSNPTFLYAAQFSVWCFNAYADWFVLYYLKNKDNSKV
jgi:hypothetical protein